MSDVAKLFWFVALFQFFHWFDPSQPYFTEYALLQFNISESTLLLEVFAWDVLFQVAGGIGVAALALLVGQNVALLAVAVASILASALVLFLSSFGALLASQACFGIAFTASVLPLYTSFSVLSQLERLDLFPRAASLNRSAMLSASFVSSLVGFVISAFQSGPSLGNSSNSLDVFGTMANGRIPRVDAFFSAQVADVSLWKSTFYATFASAVVSFLVVVVTVAPFRLGCYGGKWRRQLRLRGSSLCPRASLLRHADAPGHMPQSNLPERSLHDVVGPSPGVCVTTHNLPDESKATGLKQPFLPFADVPQSASSQPFQSLVLDDRREVSALHSSTKDVLARGEFTNFCCGCRPHHAVTSVWRFPAFFWVFSHAVIQSCHVEVMTLWQAMAENLCTGEALCIRNNGIVSGVMHFSAAVVVFLPLHRINPRISVPVILAICAGLLVLLSYVTTYWQLAILLVVYNSSAEAFFVLASTNIGLDLRHYFRSPTQSGSASPLHPTNSVADVESTPPLATNAAPLPQMLIAPASRESTIAASTKCGPPRRSYRVCLLFALGARYVLAFLIEIVMQLILFPQWGSLPNIFGLDLDLAHRIFYFGVLCASACLLGIALAFRGASLCTRGSRSQIPSP